MRFRIPALICLLGCSIASAEDQKPLAGAGMGAARLDARIAGLKGKTP